MSNSILDLHVIDVGAADPTARGSPIVTEFDEDYSVVKQMHGDAAQCIYNGVAFDHGVYVRSGVRLLQCLNGVWVGREISEEP